MPHLVLTHCVLRGEVAVVRVDGQHGGGHQTKGEEHQEHDGGEAH